MKKIHLIYNPNSGSGQFKNTLDNFIKTFNNVGFYASIYRTTMKEDIEKYIVKSEIKKHEPILIAGGDGTVNELINVIINNNMKNPIGIIPAGTSNDLARFLKIPPEFDECYRVLSKMNIRDVDVGCVNDKYFINVLSAGLFASVSQNTKKELKNTLGKLAYYIKGAEQLPNFKSMKLKITTKDNCFEDDYVMFLLLNSSGAGGFEKLSATAEIDDGYLDFIGIKETSITDISRLFIKILKGNHLNDPNILFLREKDLKIELLNNKKNYEYQVTDVDGEEGPQFPLDISITPSRIKLIVNNNNDTND